MAKKTLKVFQVIIMYPAKKEVDISNVLATTNVRAFMKALAASKWAKVDVDEVLYHTNELSYFEVED